MKRKITAIICTISMLCALFLPVSGSETTTNPTRTADVFDTLDILKHIIKMIEPLPLETHDVNQNGEVEILDALEMLKGMVKMRKPVEMPREKIMLPSCPGCGDERFYYKTSIEENFRDDFITVVLTHCASIKDNRDWTAADFPGIGEIKVEYTKIPDEIWALFQAGRGNETMINWAQYRRIFIIRFDKPSKKNVLKAVEQLIQREDICYIGVGISSKDSPLDIVEDNS